MQYKIMYENKKGRESRLLVKADNYATAKAKAKKALDVMGKEYKFIFPWY